MFVNNRSMLLDCTLTAAKSPFYHEPLVAIVVNVNVMDRSIETDNPRPELWFHVDHVTHFTFDVLLELLAEYHTFIRAKSVKVLRCDLLDGSRGDIMKMDSDVFCFDANFIRDEPPPPNHMFDFPANDPSSSDDSDEKFEEDPQEEPEEALEEDPEEDHEEAPEEEVEEPEEEPKEAQQIDLDFGLWDEEENEADLIFPYEAEGLPYPLPPVSLDVEPEMNIAGHVLRAIREATREENIILRRKFEDVEIRYTD
ncbi:hypothetical protein Tco_0749518 [Tanacetum coccineum]|uniref:Uncharacterized protein n=1 Tax=Tanacetum coccineum TaxID=301880 RepID=A0ABQ4Z1Q5_9ASTR